MGPVEPWCDVISVGVRFRMFRAICELRLRKGNLPENAALGLIVDDLSRLSSEMFLSEI